MDGIPPARPSDNEDVSWALATAESFWRKDARVDAIVWLKRAARAAAESGDEERASDLAQSATALTDVLAQLSPGHLRAAAPLAGGESDEPGGVDDLLEASTDDAVELSADDLISELPPTPAVEGASPALEGITRMGPGTLSTLDLTSVGLFASAPRSDLEWMVDVADVMLCEDDACLPAAALALVLEGTARVQTASGGVVVRGVQGSLFCLDQPSLDAGIEVVASSNETTIATWSRQVRQDLALRIPAVAEALAVEAVRLGAWAELAETPFAQQVPEDVRLRVLGKLELRTLAPEEELIGAGERLPGILLVASGSIVAGSDEVTAGEFVYSREMLSAGCAEARAVAGATGATLLHAGRTVTQELAATEPLLVALLAGM